MFLSLDIYQSAKLIDYNPRNWKHGLSVRNRRIENNVPVRPREWLARDGDGWPGLRVATMARNAEGTKRDWHRDNNVESAFTSEMERFFSSEDLLAALCAANDSKVGAPFRVPDCVIEWGAKKVVRDGIGYRTVAAILNARLSDLGFPGLSYSQFFKRMGRLRIDQCSVDVTDARVLAYGAGAVPGPGPVVGVMDSTGVTPDPPSGWRVYHWDLGSVRGWYKVHTLVDADSGEILSYVLTEPTYNDGLAFDRLYDLAVARGHRFSKIMADAAYDSKAHWNRMREEGVEFIANLSGCLDQKRRNASSGKAKGCSTRAVHVKKVIEVGVKEWKKDVGYGRRWRVEATYGDLKRRFGETLRARAPERIRIYIHWLIVCFNQFKAIRKSMG